MRTNSDIRYTKFQPATLRRTGTSNPVRDSKRARSFLWYLATVAAPSALVVACTSAADPSPVDDTSASLCSWSGRDFAATNGKGLYRDPGGFASALEAPVDASSGSSYHIATAADSCVSETANDALSVAQRELIQTYNCSAPYYFEAYNSDVATPATNPTDGRSCRVGVDSWSCWPDKSNGFPQLCPYSEGLQKYVAALGLLVNGSGQVSDLRPHFAHDPDASWQLLRVPSTEEGATPSAPTVNGVSYVWVIPWEDPHACAGGCMTAI